MSAYYIDDNQQVHNYTCICNNQRGTRIQLDDGRIIEEPHASRMFAVHPSQSQHCRLINGVWHYKGRSLSDRPDERAWVDGHGLVMLPDKMLEPKPRYKYRPCRGYSGSLAVEDVDGQLIGWVSINDLGYHPPKGVQDWMRATGYEVQGDGN